MLGIIVDTSVWIQFFNGVNSWQTDQLKKYIISDRPVFLCPIIIQEILQGIKNDSDYEKVKNNLLGFTLLKWDALEAAIAAAQLYRNMRKRGITIRKSNDCSIAAFAIHFKLVILHVDRDFYIMAKHSFIKECTPSG